MDQAQGQPIVPLAPLAHTNGHAAGSERLRPWDYQAYSPAPSSAPSVSSRAPSIAPSTPDGSAALDEVAHLTMARHRRELALDVTCSRLFLVALAFRSLNAVVSRGFWVPDEYWQSLEVAHRIVFGYGHLTWEWLPSPDANLDGWTDGPIRSAAHAVVFVPVYALLKVLGLDGSLLLTLAPRLVQAAFAALADVYTFRLACRTAGQSAAYAALLSSFFSAYLLYTSTRTLSNSLEATFTVMALYHWPLSQPEGMAGDLTSDVSIIPGPSFRRALLFASLAIMTRPTSLILWLFLGVELVHRTTASMSTASEALEAMFTLVSRGIDAVAIGTVSQLLNLLIDSAFYGRLTFTPAAFLVRNVLQSVSVFYGASPWHFHLTSSLPVLLLSQLPFAASGFWSSIRRVRVVGVDKVSRRWYGPRGEPDPLALQVLAQLCCWTVLCYSLLSHKEFRFLQPIVPVLHVFCGYSMALLGGGDERGLREEAARERGEEETRVDAQRSGHVVRPSPAARQPRSLRSALAKLHSSWARIGARRRGARLALLANLPVAAYLVVFHGKGQIQVMHRLAKLVDRGELVSVAFLMPCHSTPWQSHLHRPSLEMDTTDVNGSGRGGKAWFISCEPPRSRAALESGTYKDQSDVFYDDVASYLSRHFPASVDLRFPPSPVEASSSSAYLWEGAELPASLQHSWPSHVVVFDELLARPGGDDRTVASLLASKGYVERERLWNSLAHDDPRRFGDVVILAWDAKGRGV